MDDIIIEVVAKRPSFVVNLEVTNTKAEISQIIANMFKGDKGDKGERGLQGERGVGIESIIKSSSIGLVDTYVINFSDGTTTTYQITNGKDGKDGLNGKDGKSAYEFAKDGGYIGTDQDFSNDLSKVKYLVPNTTTINGKPLSSNINLSASDVNALPDTTIIPSDYVSYRNEQNLTEYQKQQARENIGALSSDITIPDGVKLYDGVGQNTDGAITQKGTTDALININNNLENQIIEANNTIQSVGNSLKSLNTTVDTIDTNLSNLHQTVNGNVQDISVLQSNVDTNTKNISTLRNDFTNESIYCNTNIETLNSAVNFLTINKANKDLSNVTYPQLTPDGKVHTQSGYTTYMSTDSNTWYILYPTGKKECGVSFKDSTDGDTTVTLPISFNSTSFVCTFSGGTNDVFAMIRIEKLDKNKVRVRFAKSFNTVNPYPSYGCLKCEGI